MRARCFGDVYTEDEIEFCFVGRQLPFSRVCNATRGVMLKQYLSGTEEAFILTPLLGLTFSGGLAVSPPRRLSQALLHDGWMVYARLLA